MHDLVYFQAALCPPASPTNINCFFQNPAISSVLAEPVNLAIFSLLGGTCSTLRTFLGETSEKEHPVDATHLCCILSIFVTTDVYALFTKSAKKICNINVQNGILNNVQEKCKIGLGLYPLLC